MTIDALDARILELFSTTSRMSVLEATRQLGVARATVQSRLDKLEASGAITATGLHIDPSRIGYPVSAFVSLRVEQGAGHEPVATILEAIPEVIEVHTVSGSDDMLCRVVARSNSDLQRVLDLMSGGDAQLRSSSAIVLRTHFEDRTAPLLRAAAPR